MHKAILTISTAVATCVLAAGCGAKIELPPGFVALEADRAQPYDTRAVTADGVTLAIRTQRNPADGTVDFWAQAATNELTGRGYSAVGDPQPLKSAVGMEGRLLSFTSRREGVEFAYLVGVYVRGREVVLTEAGGRADRLAPQRDAIVQAMQTVR